MPTDNPKVSAYVPQALKDRLTQFRQEQGNISESQAVTIVLSEYFGIPTNVNSASEGVTVGCVTPTRLEQLERQVAILTSTIEEIKSSLLSKPTVNQVAQVENEQTESSLDSELKEKTTEENQIDSSSVSSLPDKPLTEYRLTKHQMAKRIKTTVGTFDNRRSVFSPEELSQWIQKKDPDSIAWKGVREGKILTYVPNSELSIEQDNRLRAWIEKNP